MKPSDKLPKDIKRSLGIVLNHLDHALYDFEKYKEWRRGDFNDKDVYHHLLKIYSWFWTESKERPQLRKTKI